MRLGGISDPRNKILMKMFNLINIGERAGSGVPNIFNTWADQGWIDPVIEEQFDPDKTILTLAFKKKQAKKASDIAEYLDLSAPRIRAILKDMPDIEFRFIAIVSFGLTCFSIGYTFGKDNHKTQK